MVTGYGNKKSATKDFVALFVGCVDYLSEWALLRWIKPYTAKDMTHELCQTLEKLR